MKTIQQYIQTNSMRFLDHSKQSHILGEANRAFISFAIDDAIATTVGNKTALPTARMWVHPPTLVLGIPDSRLPYLEEGIAYMKAHKHQVIIRNSGGLAVLLDQGVLNVSFILPNDKKLSIHEGYDLMYHFIQQLFSPYTDAILAYEIVGSYCPGDYDLSIRGVKFAGISQRRVRQGVAVQIYLDVEGSSYERASLVRRFYDLSKKGETTKHTYPEVDPHVMGTISQLTNHAFTVEGVILEIKRLLNQSFYLEETSLSHQEADLFHKRLDQMVKRNKAIRS